MLIPTAADRTDKALTLAQTKASAYADSGAMEMAYRTMLKGVQAAQRYNAPSTSMTTQTGLLGSPVIRTLLIGAISAGSAFAVYTAAKKQQAQTKTETIIIPGESPADRAAAASADPITPRR